MIIFKNVDGTVAVDSKARAFGRHYLRPDLRSAPMPNPTNDPSPFYGIDRSVQYHRTYRRATELAKDVWLYEEVAAVAEMDPAVVQQRFEEAEAEWVRLGAFVDELRRRAGLVSNG